MMSRITVSVDGCRVAVDNMLKIKNVNGPYCVHCGISDNEDGYSYMHRTHNTKFHNNRALLSMIVNVGKTERGYVCELCHDMPLIELNFDSKTGNKNCSPQEKMDEKLRSQWVFDTATLTYTSTSSYIKTDANEIVWSVTE